jgi:integrase
LRRALSQGVKWGWLPTNPAALASPPKVVQQEARPPSPEEVAKLINAAWAADPDFGTLLWVAMTTGARRGELCALRWSHVRFQEGDLLITSNYVVRRRGRKVKDTKTHQSPRIAMDKATSAILAEHLERCRTRAAVYGCELAPDGYVFSLDPDGHSPRLPDSVTRRMTRLAHRLGMPGRHLHEFRHYSATQLLAAGVDLRTVAGRLGHGGGAVTLRVYASFVAAADRRAAELLGGKLAPPGFCVPACDSVTDGLRSGRHRATLGFKSSAAPLSAVPALHSLPSSIAAARLSLGRRHIDWVPTGRRVRAHPRNRLAAIPPLQHFDFGVPAKFGCSPTGTTGSPTGRIRA